MVYGGGFLHVIGGHALFYVPRGGYCLAVGRAVSNVTGVIIWDWCLMLLVVVLNWGLLGLVDLTRGFQDR